MSASQDFISLMSRPGDVPLDRALFLLGECRPDSSFTLAQGMTELDQLAAGCDDRTLDGLLQYLFVNQGFIGDRVDYHHPNNSFLDAVLSRKQGMPISLSVVLIEVGRRIGIELKGVGMPGHFVVKESSSESLIDPFNGGVRMTPAECEAKFHSIQGGGVPFQASFLNPVPNRAIIVRVLNNLTHAYRARESQNLDWLLDIRLDIFPDPGELQLLAQLCERRARYGDAANLLEQLLEFLEEGPAHKRVANHVIELRARLN